MQSAYEAILAEVDRRAGSDESRALILSKVLSAFEGKTVDITLYGRYRISHEDRNKILRGKHPDFPNLISLHNENKELKRQIQGVQGLLKYRPFGSSLDVNQRFDLVRKQQTLEEKRHEIRRLIVKETTSILGTEVYTPPKNRHPIFHHAKCQYGCCTGKHRLPERATYFHHFSQ
jgi:hypothetical protein